MTAKPQITIPEIKAKADATILKAVSKCMEQNMTQEDIARVLDVSKPWMSRFINKHADALSSNPKIDKWNYRAIYYQSYK